MLVVEWTKKMGIREGFGDKLAEGSIDYVKSYKQLNIDDS